MRAATPTFLALLLLAAHARAQNAPANAPTSAAVDSEDATVATVQKRIAEEPTFAAMVAKRINDSQLSGVIAPLTDGDARLAKVSDWIAKDPESAARLAIGLYGDDASGNHAFEEGLLRQTRMTVEDNTKGNKGSLGRLRDASKNSRLLKAQQDQLSEDEKREIMRTLFEGQGAQTGTVLNQRPDGSGNPPPSGPGVGTGGVSAAFGGIYDRLSGANLRGYSPQLVALQSSLNQRRPPGAPALIETGKLDYPTLAFPAYGIEYDVRGLESRVARDRILALARLAGVALTAGDWKDPDLEKKLLAKIPADRLPPRLKRRAELAAKARAALQAFLDAAAAAKDPAKISKELVVELGRRQRDAARWITVAALEEDLSRIDELDGFLTPELLDAVASAPAAADVRAAYKDRGQALQQRVAAARADAEKASGLLAADSWEASLAEVDRLTASERSARKSLERDIPVYARVPFRVAGALTAQARWREWLDDLAVRWAPSTDYARAVTERRGRLTRWLSAFGEIARGDFAAAAAVFAELEPPAH